MGDCYVLVSWVVGILEWLFVLLCWLCVFMFCVMFVDMLFVYWFEDFVMLFFVSVVKFDLLCVYEYVE